MRCNVMIVAPVCTYIMIIGKLCYKEDELPVHGDDNDDL